jgi:hypothetical protein
MHRDRSILIGWGCADRGVKDDTFPRREFVVQRDFGRDSHWPAIEKIRLVVPLLDGFYGGGSQNGIPADKLNTLNFTRLTKLDLKFDKAANAGFQGCLRICGVDSGLP